MKHERIAVTPHHLIKIDDPAPKTARMIATYRHCAFEGGEK